MDKRVLNIRVVFVFFIGLMVGILFCLFNTFQYFKLWKIILFFFIIFCISLGLYLYGFFTRKKNALYRERKHVSFLTMASGVSLLVSTIIGFVITIYPTGSMVNLKSFEDTVRIEGVVCDYVVDKTTYNKFILSDCCVEYNGEVYDTDYKVCVYADLYTHVNLGDKLILNDCTLNKYSFSNSSDLIKLSQGIGYQTYVNFDNVNNFDGSFILRDKVKSSVYDILHSNLNDDNGTIVYAMLFGDKEGLNENIKNSFSYAGISHILAVSGLHVGILATAILFLLKKIKMDKYIRIIILAIVLCFYAYLCSYSPSVCRAGIMTVLLALCQALQIEYDGLSSLSIAGIIILLFSPVQILSLSFQLSFLSVFAIISFAPSITRLLNKIKLPKFLSSSIAISVATNIAILPVCANVFSKVSLLGIFSNLLVIPLFTLAYILTFFIIIFTLVFGFCGVLLNIPNLFLHLIKIIADGIANIDLLVLKTFQSGYLILFFVCAFILVLHFLMVRKLVKLSILLPLLIISIVQFSLFNIEYSSEMNTLVFSKQYKSNVVFYVKDSSVTMIGSNIECNNLYYMLKNSKLRHIDSIIAYDLQLNEINNLKEICKECNVSKVFVPIKYKYEEISNGLKNVSYYENNLNVLDLNLNEISLNDQTIGIYLNISEVGDILIPELKPTKKEGEALLEYKNIDLELLGADNVITNSGEEYLSLEDLGTIYLNKEYSV